MKILGKDLKIKNIKKSNRIVILVFLNLIYFGFWIWERVFMYYGNHVSYDPNLVSTLLGIGQGIIWLIDFFYIIKQSVRDYFVEELEGELKRLQQK